MSCECESVSGQRTHGFRKDHRRPVQDLNQQDLEMRIKSHKHEVDERRKQKGNTL